MLQFDRSPFHSLLREVGSAGPPASAAQSVTDAAPVSRPMHEDARLRWQLERELGALKAELSVARARLRESRSPEQRARAQAGMDCLTGLGNRRTFDDRLRYAFHEECANAVDAAAPGEEPERCPAGSASATPRVGQ